MNLPIFTDKNDVFQLMQQRWASIINPFLSKAFVKGQLLPNVSLINGATVVNHKLGRIMQGWIIADQNAAASIYRSAAFNDLTLTLTSNASVTVNLWVF